MYEGRALRDKLQAGTVCLGTWHSFADPCVTECLCGAGFDFIIIDAEHGALDLGTVQAQCLAMKGTGVEPIVRVAWNDPVRIKPLLDMGAGGIVAPLVRSAEEVEAAVAACLYPPQGVRGYGPRRPIAYGRHFADYIAAANDSLVIWVQVEHIDAVDDIERIVRVPRLDGIIVGSNDLSGSMGLLGQPQHPDVLAAIDRVIAATRGTGVAMGLAGPDQPELAAAWIARGVQFLTLGWDAGLLSRAVDAAVAGTRALVSGA